MQILKTLLLAVAMAAGLFAQTANKPLTNQEIESMVTAGLPESTIVITIEAAAARGLVDLDASPAALTALKQKGASERVLNAVLWAEPLGAELKRKQEEDRAVPGLPDASGVYRKVPSGWVALRPFLLWPPFYSGSYFGGAHAYSVPLSGSHSEIQIGAGQQTFYLREPPSDAEWRIIALSSRDNERLLHLVSSGHFFSTDRLQPEQLREVRITRVAGGIFTLRPVAALEPGEYVLCTAVPGGPDLNVCYGFGVRR